MPSFDGANEVVRVAGAVNADAWFRCSGVRPPESDRIRGENLVAAIVVCFPNELAFNDADERLWVLKTSIRQVLLKSFLSVLCTLQKLVFRKKTLTSSNVFLGAPCLSRNDFMLHRGCSCVCRLPPGSEFSATADLRPCGAAAASFQARCRFFGGGVAAMLPAASLPITGVAVRTTSGEVRREGGGEPPRTSVDASLEASPSALEWMVSAGGSCGCWYCCCCCCCGW